MSNTDMQKIILVTGGSGDIGGEIIDQLAKEKTNIVCLQYSGNYKRALKVKGDFENVFLFQQDFFQELCLVENVVKKFGRIDVLVNCAGVLGGSSFLNLTSEEFDKVFHINTKTPYLLTSKAFGYMEKNNYGRIINISSFVIKYGMGRNNTIHYAGSKAALESLTHGLSRIGAKSNILVNTIRPGIIETDMQRTRKDLEKRKEMIPLKRLGKLDEISSMVLYLISDRADFITGQTITISGGE